MYWRLLIELQNSKTNIGISLHRNCAISDEIGRRGEKLSVQFLVPEAVCGGEIEIAQLSHYSRGKTLPTVPASLP